MNYSLIHERDGKLCVRRIMGIIGFMTCIAAVFLHNEHTLLPTLMWCSAGLLGSAAVDLLSKRDRDGKLGGGIGG